MSLPQPNKWRTGSKSSPLEIDSDTEYQALGIATIDWIGEENIYLVKDNVHYFAKVGGYVTLKMIEADLEGMDVDFSCASYIDDYILPVVA
jgi:hypothetical protein